MCERVSEDDWPSHRCAGSGHLSRNSERLSGLSECPRKCGGSQLFRAPAGLLGAGKDRGDISLHPRLTAQGASPAC